MIWKSVHDGQIRKYDFSYDNVNRLTNAAFTQYYSGGFNTNAGIDYSVSNLAYDPNGNILTMNQNGLASLTATNSTPIDQLTYTYIPGTNKLQSVADAVNNPNSTLGDFKYNPGDKTGTDYGYDGNGNMISDVNKKIASINYNFLNLPNQVTITSKGTVTYTYDATGNKLQKQTVDNTNGSTTTTVYVGGCVYVNDVMQFMAQEEGRIRVNASNSGFIFDYYLKDHLGDTRMTITDDNTAANPVVDATSYYPFGLAMAGISYKLPSSLENKYKYNKGSELQHQEFSDGSGLEWYDTHYRQLDVQLGRWNQIDPKCEIAINANVEGNDNIEDESEVGNLERMSPYMSMGDDPIKHNDPKGDEPCCPSAAQVWAQTDELEAEVDPEIGRPLVTILGTVATAGALIWDLWTDLSNKHAQQKAITTTKSEMAPNNVQAKAKKETGSYTNTHESGKKYHGKGDEKRAAQSGKEKATKYNDPLKSTDYKKAKNNREAFKDESRRLKRDGGHKSNTNYNERDSPGTKYRKQDGEKP